MIANLFSSLALAAAQSPVDRYQKVGKEVGETYSSIGNVLNNQNADAAHLSSAASDADRAIASLRSELSNIDWSYLGPQAAAQQNQNLQIYLNDLDNENARLHAMATQAAIAERNQPVQAQTVQPAQYYQQNAWSVPTGMPKLQQKAVVKEDSISVSTTSTEEPTSTLNSKESKKESKSESKESKKESKSESEESKKEAKTSARENAAATGNSTISSNSSSTSTHATSTKHHNGAATMGVSGGALFLAVLALILED